MAPLKQLELAFSLSREEHSDAFERFTNAFLVDDYPELEGLGGKHDAGMDARVIEEADASVSLVVQSCVSPANRARSKVLATVAKLSGRSKALVYCTTAKIGIGLDKTKMELRKEHGINLSVYDSEWFGQRILTSANRTALCDAYISSVLSPLLKEIRNSNTYTVALSANEARIAIKYLEAHQIDGSTHRNFTKQIFDSLIIYATRNTAFPSPLMALSEVISAICSLFPAGHATRIQEIVPGRVDHLVGTDVIKRHPGNKLSLSNNQKVKFEQALDDAAKREIAFRAYLSNVLTETLAFQQIDYEIDADRFVKVAHQCILWFLREQGTQLRDGTGSLINVLNAEEVVELFVRSPEYNSTRDNPEFASVEDILPHVVFNSLNSDIPDVVAYLRSKADLFIVESFLQTSPDVQQACKKLFSDDILYADTSILIRCLAEKYSTSGDGPLLRTFQLAKKVGIKIKTFRPWVEEFASHLKGPVKLEWINRAGLIPLSEMEIYLKTSPTLIGVFREFAKANNTRFEEIIDEIIGSRNEVENGIEFIAQEFGIETVPVPDRITPEQHLEWEQVFGIWLAEKRLWPGKKPERFEILVRNDVNAFSGAVQLRQSFTANGSNYGHKVWILTLDRMFWRVPRSLKWSDDVYRVAMSLHFLVNFVATISNVSGSGTDANLPAAILMSQGGFIPPELREALTKEWTRPGKKRYQVDRHIRALLSELKSKVPDSESDSLIDRNVNLLDEQI